MNRQEFRVILEHCHSPGINSDIHISMMVWRDTIVVVVVVDNIILNQICVYILIFVKFGQKCDTLYVKTCMRFCSNLENNSLNLHDKYSEGNEIYFIQNTILHIYAVLEPI
jgi:hypothetical protein